MSDRPDSGYKYLVSKDPRKTRNRGLLIAIVCLALMAVTYYLQ